MINEQSRIERARRRGRNAKAALGALTALVFGFSFVAAKAHASSHTTKGHTKPLGAPSSFQKALGQSSLQGGQIAPSTPAPSAAPPASSSSS